MVLVVKNLSANAADARDLISIPGLGRSPEGGNGNPLQYHLEKSHGQRILVGYRPWGYKESDMTEHLSAAAWTYLIILLLTLHTQLYSDYKRTLQKDLKKFTYVVFVLNKLLSIFKVRSLQKLALSIKVHVCVRMHVCVCVSCSVMSDSLQPLGL